MGVECPDFGRIEEWDAREECRTSAEKHICRFNLSGNVLPDMMDEKDTFVQCQVGMRWAGSQKERGAQWLQHSNVDPLIPDTSLPCHCVLVSRTKVIAKEDPWPSFCLGTLGLWDL